MFNWSFSAHSRFDNTYIVGGGIDRRRKFVRYIHFDKRHCFLRSRMFNHNGIFDCPCIVLYTHKSTVYPLKVSYDSFYDARRKNIWKKAILMACKHYCFVVEKVSREIIRQSYITGQLNIRDFWDWKLCDPCWVDVLKWSLKFSNHPTK